MKLIKAIVRPNKVDEVKAALATKQTAFVTRSAGEVLARLRVLIGLTFFLFDFMAFLRQVTAMSVKS